VVLIMTAGASVMDAGLAGRNNAGPHGLSEMLYAFTSAGSNNGSAFAGLTGGTYFYNTMMGMAMLIGRFALVVPALALGGFLSERRVTPETAGTFPVDTPLFVGLLVSVILIVGALTYFPVLALGPVVEHLMMNAGWVF
jgi:K+-transporting ATPase ATPase A chain